MPTYAETRTDFKTILTRRDCTDADADTFLRRGINRINRLLRVPEILTRATYTLDAATYSNAGYLPRPASYVKLKDISVIGDVSNGGGLTLARKELGYVQSRSVVTAPGVPTAFASTPQGWVFGDSYPQASTQINVDYYAKFPVALGDSTVLTGDAQDLLIFAALVAAGSRWNDKRKPDWEMTFTQILSDVQAQADDDELTGGAAVKPAFTYPTDF